MAENESILEKAREKGLATPAAGMDVPPGYFEEFATKMAASLPFRAEAEAPETIVAQQSRSLWTRIRPYIYLAAMFAGIWLMLQMFAMMSGSRQLKPMEENPVLAEALSNDDFMFDYIYDDFSSYEIAGVISDEQAEESEVSDIGVPVEMTEDGSAEGVVLPDSML